MIIWETRLPSSSRTYLVTEVRAILSTALRMESFKYSPLDHSFSEIRLVHLLPRWTREGSHGIRCEMKTVSLAACPEYIALSYTWGDSTRTSLLIIDNTISHITTSVQTALLHLQHETNTIILWIDQLCINQDDNVEKSKQVQLMKAIYQKALSVGVWLGPAADESDQLIDVLSDVGEEACESRLMQMGLSQDERDLEYKDSYNRLGKRLGKEPTIPLESMRSFVNRPYWSRVWIVQELSLARDVQFACGNKRISYDRLRHALYFFARYIRFTLKDFTDRNSMDEISLNPEKSQRLATLASAPIDSAAIRMLTTRSRYHRQIENQGHELIRILEFCHVIGISESGLKATDPRDNIYGLLGLTRDAEALGVRPDYSASTSKVYIDTARALIRSGQVDLLWLCQFSKATKDLPIWVPDRSATEYLPTWVPNWSAPLQTPYGDNFTADTPTFSASAKISACVTSTEDTTGFITVRGAVVDEVAVIGRPWGPGDSHLSEEYTSQFLTEIDQLCNEASHLHNEIFQDHQVLDEARWRTPIGDKEHTDRSTARRATSLSHKGYQDVLGRIEMRRSIPTLSLDQMVPLLERFFLTSEEEMSYRNYMKEMSNRRPFRSKKGYVGLGPVLMRPGDLVCIILGAQVPYVLRPCESHRYQLVG
jgi:hypothetical protein